MPQGIPPMLSKESRNTDLKERVSWHKRYRRTLILFSVSLISLTIAFYFMIIPLFPFAGVCSLITFFMSMYECYPTSEMVDYYWHKNQNH